MNIVINGYNINYKISGSGDKTVVMLQGWGTDMSIYDSVANTINEQYRFVQFNFPGFGKSDEPREAWSVDDYADFFCEFMEALEIKEAALIGHSYGGRVIIKLANRENIPFTITKIVLLDSAGILPPKSLGKRIKIAKYKIIKRIVNVKMIYALFPEVIDEWRSRQGSADYKNASPIMRQCLVKAVNEDLTGLLSSIKQETLLIWGDEDTATPISDARTMEALIPNSGLAILKGAGHFSFLDQPIVFKNVMRVYFKIGVVNEA